MLVFMHSKSHHSFWFFQLIYSKTRSGKTIGAINDQPYNATQSQLDIILIHIEAGFEFNVSNVEFGLRKKKKENLNTVTDTLSK